jgi:hypothetical protein
MTEAPAGRRKGVMIAMFDIPDELTDEFNTWYNEEHIPEKVGTVPGFLRATRYKSLDGRPNYLAIYELEDIKVLEDTTYQSNYKGASPATIKMKSKAKTFFRATYEEIFDAPNGIPLPPEEA